MVGKKNGKKVFLPVDDRLKPIDELDKCYQAHDVCYENCRMPFRNIIRDSNGNITDVIEGCPFQTAPCFSKCDYESIPCQLKALEHLSETLGYDIQNPFIQLLRYPIRTIGVIGGIPALGGQGLKREYIDPVWDWTRKHSDWGIIISPPNNRGDSGYIGIGIIISW